jgi:NitT/TauT family transport system substrate-binding protein
MKSHLLVLALVPIVAVAAACGGGGDKADGAPGKKLDKVTLTLNWYPYGEHAPFYYGKKQGIFAKHGINLQIKAGQGSQKTVQATGAGQTDFGWADTPALLAGVSQGLQVKSIGVYLQTTPAAVQFFTDKAIKTPADLKGRRIASTAGDAPSRTFPTFLRKNGLGASDVHLQNTDPAGKMAAVISGRTDGLIGYANDQGPTMAAKAGRQVSYLRFADFGVNFYSDGLLVGDRRLKSDADLVKRMSAATSEAWAAAAKDPANAVAAMRGASQQLPSATVLTDQFTTTLSLLHTTATQGRAPGVNTDADWQQTITVFTQSGLIGKAQPPSAYWDSSAAPQG